MFIFSSSLQTVCEGFLLGTVARYVLSCYILFTTFLALPVQVINCTLGWSLHLTDLVINRERDVAPW